MSDAPFFHEASATVRFSILVDGKPFGASVGREALHYRFRPTTHGDDPLETYAANAAEIEAAVRRRVGEGAREPVMLREYDLRVVGAQGKA
jgi:hypothetical protein